MSDFKLLPETSTISHNCVDPSFLFHDEAKKVFDDINTIVRSFKDTDFLVPNNVIGIIGDRGSGKTSLLASINSTLKEHRDVVESTIYPISDLIDPKTIPDVIGIVDLTLANLFSYFRDNCDGVSDEKADDIYGKFEELNKIVSILSQSQRQAVVDNPSDLVDICSIPKIRTKFEELVADMLAIKGNNPKESAFLISIDDFDIDSSNCHRMALEINSYLRIRGVIFLLSLNFDIFLNELTRARVKALSDYGRASEAYFAPYVSLVRPQMSYSRRSARTFENSQLFADSKKYAQQLINKLLPRSVRVEMKTHNALEGRDGTAGLLRKLAYMLFGVSPESSNEHPCEKKSSDFLIETFVNALTDGKDLRVTNQAVNRVIELVRKIKGNSLRENLNICADLCSVFEETADARNDYGNSLLYGACVGLNAYLKKPSPVFYDTVGESAYAHIVVDDEIIDVAKYIEPRFNKFPCAYIAYEFMVDHIDIHDQGFVEQYYWILKLCIGDNPNASLTPIPIEGKITSFSLKGQHVESADLLTSFKTLGRRDVLTEINNALQELDTKVTKKKVYSIVSMLANYAKTIDDETEEYILSCLSDIESAMNVPWKGEKSSPEIRQKAVEDVRRILNIIKRRI